MKEIEKIIKELEEKIAQNDNHNNILASMEQRLKLKYFTLGVELKEKEIMKKFKDSNDLRLKKQRESLRKIRKPLLELKDED